MDSASEPVVVTVPVPGGVIEAPPTQAEDNGPVNVLVQPLVTSGEGQESAQAAEGASSP